VVGEDAGEHPQHERTDDVGHEDPDRGTIGEATPQTDVEEVAADGAGGPGRAHHHQPVHETTGRATPATRRAAVIVSTFCSPSRVKSSYMAKPKLISATDVRITLISV